MNEAPPYFHLKPCPDEGWEYPDRSNSSGTKYLHEDEFKDLESDIADLLAERDKLRVALEVYAVESNYDYDLDNCPDKDNQFPILQDAGKIAREALGNTRRCGLEEE
jgi:hypothetical protein